jgi:hypothetical protein
MKKLLAIAIVLMMVPFSAFAMETISDSDMDNVTGQAGVSISISNVKIYQTIDSLAFVDTDGVAALGGAGGAIGLANFKSAMTIDGFVNGVDADFGDVATAVGYTGDTTPLTIDVAQYPVLGTAVIIGVPTLEIMTHSMSFDINVSNVTDETVDLSTAAATESLGKLVIKNNRTILMGGTVAIAAH